MRSVLLTAAQNAIVKLMPILVSESQRSEAYDRALDQFFEARDKRAPVRRSDASADPYMGIRTTGRRGAAERLALQMEGFKQTRVAKRNAQALVDPRGRSTGRPFTSDARNNAFVDALLAGRSHSQALKLARRVAA